MSEPSATWNSWLRQTASAALGACVAFGGMLFWLAEVKHNAEDAVGVNRDQEIRLRAIESTASEIKAMREAITRVESFVNRGDRFTTDDGRRLLDEVRSLRDEVKAMKK